MGNIYYRLCVGLLSYVLLSCSAHAETIPASPNTQTPLVQYWYNGISFSRIPSQEALCAASNYVVGTPGTDLPAGYHTVTVTGTCVSVPPGGTFPGRTYLDCPVDFQWLNGACTKVGNSCPEGQGWTLSGQSCTRPDCDLGYDRNAQGQCVKNCIGKAGMATTNGDYSFQGASSTWAVSGCKVACPQRVMTAYGGAGYDCKYTGASADPDVPDAEPMQPDPENLPPENPNDCLSKGQGYIASSTGKTTCVPAQDAPDGQKPTKQESDSSKESGTPGADGKPDPTASDYKKEEKSTTSEGGNTTESTTTTTNPGTDANGNPTCPQGATLTDGKCVSKTSTSQDTTTFCQKNPTDPTCKGREENDKSSFGGTCDAGFTCEGDAAQCATAKAAHELNCSLNKKPGTADLGQSLIDGADSQLLPNPDNPSDFALNQLSYTDTGGSCLPDLQFNFGGHSSTVDTSGVCTVAGWLGSLGVALSLLAAGYFIIGGLKD